MKQDDSSEILRTAKRLSVRRKIYIFAICVLFSSAIWALIKLSKDYSETVVFIVNYTDLPEGKVIVNDPDTTLTIQIKTKGFRIISNLLFTKSQKININVEAMVKKFKNSKTGYYIQTSELNHYIGSQIHYPNNVVAIKPDTIYFNLEKKYSKKVPVKADLNLSFAQQYELSDSIKYIPDSVIISGSKLAIDTIKYIKTVSRIISNINSNQVLSLDFNQKYKKAKLSINTAQIKVFISVDKFTEAWVDLTVTIINNPNNHIVRTFPEKTKVTYQVSMEKYKEVSPQMFSAVADISKAIAASSKKLKVEIEKYPPFVRIRKIEPEKIEYILLK